MYYICDIEGLTLRQINKTYCDWYDEKVDLLIFVRKVLVRVSFPKMKTKRLPKTTRLLVRRINSWFSHLYYPMDCREPKLLQNITMLRMYCYLKTREKQQLCSKAKDYFVVVYCRNPQRIAKRYGISADIIAKATQKANSQNNKIIAQCIWKQLDHMEKYNVSDDVMKIGRHSKDHLKCAKKTCARFCDVLMKVSGTVENLVKSYPDIFTHEVIYDAACCYA